MTSKLISSRDPYPFPKLQNDENFFGPTVSEKQPYTKPTHLAQKEDPWNRLNSHCTLSSSRREVYHHDPQAPRDSLDFVLKSQYNQHEEFLQAKNSTLYQPETLNLPHGRVLKNRVIAEVKKKPYLNHELEIVEQEKKDSIHTIANAIDGHHTQITNKGYSRKPDGGFFQS